MPRKNRNAGGRRFDTRMNFKDFTRALGISPKQRIMLIRFMKKEGEQIK